jgi:hypothetical protein
LLEVFTHCKICNNAGLKLGPAFVDSARILTECSDKTRRSLGIPPPPPPPPACIKYVNTLGPHVCIQ